MEKKKNSELDGLKKTTSLKLDWLACATAHSGEKKSNYSTAKKIATISFRHIAEHLETGI